MTPWDAERTRLLGQRIVVCRGAFDEALTNATLAQLLYLRSSDGVRPVQLLLDSPGGSIVNGLAVCDLVEEWGVPVHVHTTGQAGGTALMLAVHGTAGWRSAHPDATFALAPIRTTPGRAAPSAEIERFTQMVTARLAAHTGQSEAQVRLDSIAGRRFAAHEAYDYGIIDRICVSAPPP